MTTVLRKESKIDACFKRDSRLGRIVCAEVEKCWGVKQPIMFAIVRKSGYFDASADRRCDSRDLRKGPVCKCDKICDVSLEVSCLVMLEVLRRR